MIIRIEGWRFCAKIYCCALISLALLFVYSFILQQIYGVGQRVQWKQFLANYIINSIRQKMSLSSYSADSCTETLQKRPYRKLPIQEREDLIREVMQNNLSISKAAQKLGINNSTAKVIVRNYRKDSRTKRQMKKTSKYDEPSENEEVKNFNESNEFYQQMQYCMYYLPVQQFPFPYSTPQENWVPFY